MAILCRVVIQSAVVGKRTLSILLFLLLTLSTLARRVREDTCCLSLRYPG